MDENILLKLSEEQRISRFNRVALAFQKVGLKQLTLLKNHERLNKQNLHEGFFYFIKTLESFWENFDFILSLGKGRNRTMAHYPARSMLETLFRIEYYVRQKIKGQNYIANIETLRIYKRLYDDSISKSDNTHQAIKKTYDDFLKITSLDQDPLFAINKVSEDRLDPFPSLYNLIKDSKLPNTGGLYFHYRILCEHSHGKLIASIMRHTDPKRSYRQMLMYGCIFAREMLKVVDHHIQSATREEVKDVILATERIIKAS